MNEAVKEFSEFSFKNFLTFTFFFAMFYISSTINHWEFFQIPFILSLLYMTAYISSKNQKHTLVLLIDLTTFIIIFSILFSLLIILFFSISLLSLYGEYLILLQAIPAFLFLKLIPFPWIFTERHKHLFKSTWKFRGVHLWKVLAVISTISLVYSLVFFFFATQYAIFTFFLFLPGTLAIRKSITRGLHVYPSLSKAS